MCGEVQSKNSTQSNGSGLLIAIIILLVLAIVGGIGFYMYKGGAFNSFLNNQNDTVEMVAAIGPMMVTPAQKGPMHFTIVSGVILSTLPP